MRSNERAYKRQATEKLGKVKPYQEVNEAISKDETLKHRQPTPQPKDFEEIDY